VLKVFKLISIIIIFSIIISSETFALGTLVKKDFAKINIDESAKFTVLFWNVENDYVELNVKESPEGWTIIVEPDKFVLNSSVGREYIKLPYSPENIKATPVDIIAKPPESEAPGKYEVIIAANSKLPSSGIKFSQERLFVFKVEIENPLFFKEPEKQTINQVEKNQNTPLEDSIKLETESSPNYFYAILIIIVFLSSFLIYKYS
jgi:uncharacterized membrane protein